MAARFIFIVTLWSLVYAAPTKFTVRIIHTNDMHSRFEETSQKSGICHEANSDAGKCYGGFARMTTLVRKAREEAAAQDLPTFFLNAGDTYQGTKLFSHYKWKVVVDFLNVLKPDVASLGNHEFDDGVDGLVPFLNNVTFPVVGANLDLSLEPSLATAKQMKKSTILLAKGRKIGVIGYLTPETKQLSRPRNVNFLDEVTSIREEAKILKSQGCQILIALGHSGYEVDKKIAREVEDIDLVIGGHTNTFLYNGPKPDSEDPEGFYPTVVVQPSGRKTYVVQAYAYTKYLGDIKVEFDARGEITKIEGKPILVDSSVPKADDVEDMVKKYLAPLANITSRVVGSSRVYLNGEETSCRLMECNFGNLITDAMIYHNAKSSEIDNGWTDTAVAIHQSGGIRSSIDRSYDADKMTMEDILTALPFGTILFKVQMGAKTLWEVLEWSVHDRITQNTTSHGGGFLQFSGIQVTYDVSKPLNSRVVSVKVRCNVCNVPVYEDLKMNKTYTILVPDFIYHGGDGFRMFKDLAYKNLNVTIADVVAGYINQTSPVYPGLEDRIKFVIYPTNRLENLAQGSSANSANVKAYQMPVLLFLSCFAIVHLVY